MVFFNLLLTMDSLAEAAAASQDLSADNSTPGTGEMEGASTGVSAQGTADMDTDAPSPTVPGMTEDGVIDALLTSAESVAPDLSLEAIETLKGTAPTHVSLPTAPSTPDPTSRAHVPLPPAPSTPLRSTQSMKWLTLPTLLLKINPPGWSL